MNGWDLAAIAAVIVGYAAFSRPLQTTPLTAPIVFVGCGFVLGSSALDWIHLGGDSEPVRLLAEVTLTLVLFTDAARIDMTALRHEYAVPLRLLGIGLPLTIIAGWALAVIDFSGFSVAEALVLAVILAPTDAALGQSVVSDERLPSRIRQGLNVESGLNDGLCVPLLFIAIGLAGTEADVESTPTAIRVVCEAIGYGVLFGILAGAIGGLLLRYVKRHNLAEQVWLPAVPVGIAAISYGLATPPGGSGFIAAFVAGLTYGTLRRPGEDIALTEELGGIASAATFVVFGAAVVGPVLGDLTWTSVVYGVLSLTAVRMLPVAVALVGTRARLPTVAFLGWFGPRGLASIVFTVIVLEDSAVPHVHAITVVVVFTVVLSVFAHGLTSKALTTRYAAWFGRHPDDAKPTMEAVPAAHQRWRHAARR